MDRTGRWQGTSTPDQELAALRTTAERLRAELDREREIRVEILKAVAKTKASLPERSKMTTVEAQVDWNLGVILDEYFI